MQFGFIGLGNMGGVIARNILRAGEKVMVFDLNPQRAEEFIADGATVAYKREDLANVDVLCTCLAMPQHVLGTVLGDEGLYAMMKPGAIHVEFSTIDPATANQMVTAAAEKGITYVQSTVGKTPAMAAKCEEPLFIGGDRASIDKLMPLFAKIGQPRDVDTVNASCAVKLLSNLIGMANLAVLAEGMRIGSLAGMDPNKLIELLQDTGARSFQLDVRGPWIASEDWAARFGVDLTAKDLRLGCAMSRDWGYEAKMIEQAYAYYTEASAAGYGMEDSCAVYKVTK